MLESIYDEEYWGLSCAFLGPLWLLAASSVLDFSLFQKKLNYQVHECCIVLAALCHGLKHLVLGALEGKSSSHTLEHWSSVDATRNYVDILCTCLQRVWFLTKALPSALFNVLENLSAMVQYILLAHLNSSHHILELGLAHGQLQ